MGFLMLLVLFLRAKGDNGFNTKPHERQTPVVSAEPQSDWEVHGLLHLAQLHTEWCLCHPSQQLGKHGKGYTHTLSQRAKAAVA